jgi:hypothetical protein
MELLQRNGLGHIADLEFKVLPSVVELELQGLPLDSQATRTMLEQKKFQVQEIAQSLQIEAQENGFIPRPKKGKKASLLLNPDSTQDVLGYLKSLGLNITSTYVFSLKLRKLRFDPLWSLITLILPMAGRYPGWTPRASPLQSRLK